MNVKKISFGLFGGALFTACLTAIHMGTIKKQVSAEENMAYHLEEMLTPVWEGEISYQESVLPIRDFDNSVAPIPLLYPAEEILEVKSASLSTVYQEGVDYTLSDGELVILENGSIPTLSYMAFHPTGNDLNIQAADGGYLCFHEGDWFHSRQIVVTYRHKADYKGYIPKGKADRLPNTLQRLENKEDIDLLVFGDSISVGANASGFLDVAPFLPTYPELFAKGLEEKYGVKVNVRNFSVGGQTSTWGAQEIANVLSQVDNVDIAIVAFGMNDARLNHDVYLGNTTVISDAIRAKFTHAETLLIAPMLPNPNAVGFWGNQVSFYETLEAYESTAPSGVAVVNVTKVHESLFGRKRYADMTGNNVNHPNDYLTRVYAQTLLKTLEEEPIEEVKDAPCVMPEESNSIAKKTGCGSAISSIGGGVTVVALGCAVMAKKRKG